MKKIFIMVSLFVFCSSLIVFSTPQNIHKNLAINPPFQIANLSVDEWAPAIAYNILENDFLVVYEDYRNGNADIYGQLVTPVGNLKNPSIPICTNTSDQNHPAIAYNRLDNEYLVVWQDNRDGNANVYGQRVDKDGKKLWSTNSLADSSFIICDQDSIQKHIKIAHNYTNNTYLVVWIDLRNATKISDRQYENSDVYGQRVAGNGYLLPLNTPPDTKTNFPIANPGRI